jgi:acetoacetyl-CoA synthetase
MFPAPKFFPGARMNFAANILQGRDPDAVAIYEAYEATPDVRTITCGALYSQVETTADAMRSVGVKRGDRVAAVVANTSTPIVLSLAALSIGAIWSSISPEFGTQGILDRLVQIDPVLVFAETSVIYNGKVRDLRANVSGWSAKISQGSSIRNIVLFGERDDRFSHLDKVITHEAFLSLARGRNLVFEQLPFDEPGFIFYSSGTVSLIHSEMANSLTDYVLDRGTEMHLA